MIKLKAYDVEIFPNFFSVTIIDLQHYLKVFDDVCEINKKGKKKAVPLTDKLSVAEIVDRLNTVKYKSYYITNTDDSELLPLIAEINNLAPIIGDDGNRISNHMFGYNNKGYDSLMISALLMNYKNVNSTKELITKLYEISKKIIELQKDKEEFKKDFGINILKNNKLPYFDIDVMLIFALNKCGKGVDKNGKDIYFPKSLKQTSINIKWYQLLEYKLPPITDKDINFYNNDVNYRGLTADQLNNLISDFDRYIIPEWIPSIMHYNKNDVFIVCEIVRLFMDEIKTRYSISKAYKVNVYNSSRSNIADTLFEQMYSKYSGLHPSEWKGKKTERTKMAFKRVIFPFIEFKTKPLQDMLTEMKKVVITSLGKKSFTKTITINNLTYTLATGGLHSTDTPRELISKLIDKDTGLQIKDTKELNDKLNKLNLKDKDVWNIITDNSYIYVHWDIASFYPSIVAKHRVCPDHMNPNAFCGLVGDLTDKRVTAKHSKEEFIEGILKDVFVLVLKIVINSIYGKLGYEYGDMCDRLAVLKVTINGQLMIMMLCEELELNGIEVMSANTDGIVIKLYKSKYDKFNEIADNWKAITKLDADSENYFKYINRDINNYIVEEINGKVSSKGALNPNLFIDDLQKGYNMPIVAKACMNYFIYGKDIMETLYESNDILDFCKTQNIGRQFHVGYVPSDSNDDTILQAYNKTNNVYEIQRNIRFYVSLNGGKAYKIHNITGAKEELASNQKVKILNTLDDKRIELRDINYEYYYRECLKIIDPIKLGISPKLKGNPIRKTKSGKSLIKQYSGQYTSLFDNINNE